MRWRWYQHRHSGLSIILWKSFILSVKLSFYQCPKTSLGVIYKPSLPNPKPAESVKHSSKTSFSETPNLDAKLVFGNAPKLGFGNVGNLEIRLAIRINFVFCLFLVNFGQIFNVGFQYARGAVSNPFFYPYLRRYILNLHVEQAWM